MVQKSLTESKSDILFSHGLDSDDCCHLACNVHGRFSRSFCTYHQGRHSTDDSHLENVKTWLLINAKASCFEAVTYSAIQMLGNEFSERGTDIFCITTLSQSL